MSKYTHNNFMKSFATARKGLMLAYKSQKNFRKQLTVAVLAIILGLLLRFDYIEFCLLFFAIGFVLVAELFNSVIEFALDAFYKNKYSRLVKMAKDMAAGGVLVATTTSIIIGVLLFGNRILVG